MRRFYLPAPEFLGERAVLSVEDSRHCAKVLRLEPGNRITVFDGKGSEARGTIEEVGERVEVSLQQRVFSKPLGCSITLGQAIPKGKNMDLVVQKAVELGAARIVPLLSERTVVRITPEEARRKREKWQAVAVEACKQCGRNWLPEVAAPMPPAEFFQRESRPPLALLASLQPGAKHLKEALAEAGKELGAKPPAAAVLIGPEGDFTPAESALARGAGYAPVTLGPIILRAETAAIYCLSVLAHELF